MKITINKGNWSGETDTITYGKTWIKVYGEKYSIEKEAYSYPEISCRGEIWKVYRKEDSEHPIVQIDVSEKQSYATTGFTPDVEREDKNPYVAIAQVLFNII